MDKLEEYIRKNREEFDQNQVPAMVWHNLEKELDKGKEESVPVRRLKSYMRIAQVAAMLVLVMGVGFLIGMQINGGPTYDDPQLKEFAEAERHYNSKIEDMWTVVKTSNVENQSSIAEDLKALDEVYVELRSELLSGSQYNTDEIVNDMINNYRRKIEILEEVIKTNTNHHQSISREDDNIEIY